MILQSGGKTMNKKKKELPKIIRSGIYDVLKSNKCTVTMSCGIIPVSCKSVK